MTAPGLYVCKCGERYDSRAEREDCTAHNHVTCESCRNLQSRLDSVLAAIRWCISDMGYCPPELAAQHSLMWHAKLSPFVVEKLSTNSDTLRDPAKEG